LLLLLLLGAAASCADAAFSPGQQSGVGGWRRLGLLLGQLSLPQLRRGRQRVLYCDDAVL
jgi:hypothetical protein